MTDFGRAMKCITTSDKTHSDRGTDLGTFNMLVRTR